MTTDMTDEVPEWVTSLENIGIDQGVNQEEVESTLKNDLPPQGTYMTAPEDFPVTVFVAKFEEKTDDRGRLLPGRTLIRFSGIASATIQGKKERLRYDFAISPEKRKKREYQVGESGKQEWTGNYMDGQDGRADQDDIQTRLYAQANALYKKAKGEYPKTLPQLVTFLTETPFRMRTFNMSDGKTIITQLPAGRR